MSIRSLESTNDEEDFLQLGREKSRKKTTLLVALKNTKISGLLWLIWIFLFLVSMSFLFGVSISTRPCCTFFRKYSLKGSPPPISATLTSIYFFLALQIFDLRVASERSYKSEHFQRADSQISRFNPLKSSSTI